MGARPDGTWGVYIPVRDAKAPEGINGVSASCVLAADMTEVVKHGGMARWTDEEIAQFMAGTGPEAYVADPGH